MREPGLKRVTAVAVLAAALAVAGALSLLVARQLRRGDGGGARWDALWEPLGCGRYAEARALAEAWAAEAPDAGDPRAALAEVAGRAGEAGRAWELAEEALAAGVSSAEGWAACGRAALMQEASPERRARAEAALAQAQALDPDAASVLHLQGLLARLDQDDARAVEHYTRALEARPRDAALLGARGWSHDTLEAFNAALQDAERALELAPGHLPARHLRAHVRARHLGHPDGEAELRALLAEYPHRAGLVRDLALVLQEAGRHDELRALYRRPEYAERPVPALLLLEALELLEAKAWAEAEALATRLIELGGEDVPQALLLRSRLRVKLRRGAEALADADRALALDVPAWNAQAQRRRGSALIALRRYPEAFEALAAWRALAPQDPASYTYSLTHLLLRKRHSELLQVADEFLEHLGHDPERARAGWTFRATAAAGLEDYAGACEAYSHALELQETTSLLRARGRCYARLNRWRESAADLERVTELDPGDAEAWGQLMEALQALERDVEAADAARRYLELEGTEHAARARRILRDAPEASSR